jgi:hypothetical protein
MKELEGQLPQTSDQEENREVSAAVSDRAAVGCDADKPSLGMFTVMVNGTLTARRMGTDSAEVEFEFSGTMRWFDVWDFDPRLKATVQQQQEANGDLPIKHSHEEGRGGHPDRARLPPRQGLQRRHPGRPRDAEERREASVVAADPQRRAGASPKGL